MNSWCRRVSLARPDMCPLGRATENGSGRNTWGRKSRNGGYDSVWLAQWNPAFKATAR